MDAQTALKKLTNHLLGERYYIADQVGGEQANEIIVNDICSIYKAVDETPVQRWRRRYKKCLWCKYCKMERPVIAEIDPFYKCKAKLKVVNPDIPRLFCSLFTLKED